LDIYIISVHNSEHLRVGVGSRLQHVLQAGEEEEHAAGVPMTHAMLRQEELRVSRHALKREVSADDQPTIRMEIAGERGALDD
jgi:hypothetical protein